MTQKLTLLFFTIISFSLTAQIKQSIRGKIIDFETQQAIIGASVFVETPELIGTTTDFDGNFVLKGVQTGKVTLKCSYLGYEYYESAPITLTSGKEFLITIKLVESIIKTDEVIILGVQKGRAKNESMVVSSKSFDIKETQRFAGSLNDPGRAALNSPGVQSSQDNNNDVTIRGNSTAGVLWRLEGIDVENLNHFARPGSSGGGITALSPYLLSRSDFSTGAFPAEYGNAISGVFDIKFRKGNSERYEFTARAGIIGLNFGAEGPFSKKGKSTFVVNYRYSTLGILGKMGIYLVKKGTDNIFQDVSFNIDIPTKKKAKFSIFGVGGISSEITLAKTDTAEWEVFEDYYETKYTSNLGVIGASWTQFLDSKSYLKTVIAGTYNQTGSLNDTLDFNLKHTNLDYLNFTKSKISLHSFYNRKINSRLSMKTGIVFDQKFYSYDESKFVDSIKSSVQLIKGEGNTQQAQVYLQGKYRLSDKASLIGGVHFNYLTLNNTYAVEPRISYKQKIGKAHSISLAYGLNSQVLPLVSYYTEATNESGKKYLPNLNMEMVKSHHFVFAYDVLFLKNYHIKIEPYFQYVYDAPVSADSTSTLYMLNLRKGQAQEAMVNKGTGMNYGLDFSFGKFYTNNWFLMTNASVSKSTYSPLDGKTYSSRYDNGFGVSLMGGKEFVFKKNNSVLELTMKIQYAGGFRYTPFDLAESKRLNELVTIDGDQTFSKQYKTYFKPDLRIAYKQNKKKLSWQISLDLINFLNYKNDLNFIFNRQTRTPQMRYQTGLLPILSFQIDFFKTIKRD